MTDDRTTSDDRTYRNLFERSPDAMFVMRGNRFVDCNHAAVELMGYADEEALLEDIRDAHPADFSPRWQVTARCRASKPTGTWRSRSNAAATASTGSTSTATAR